MTPPKPLSSSVNDMQWVHDELARNIPILRAAAKNFKGRPPVGSSYSDGSGPGSYHAHVNRLAEEALTAAQGLNNELKKAIDATETVERMDAYHDLWVGSGPEGGIQTIQHYTSNAEGLIDLDNNYNIQLPAWSGRTKGKYKTTTHAQAGAAKNLANIAVAVGNSLAGMYGAAETLFANVAAAVYDLVQSIHHAIDSLGNSIKEDFIPDPIAAITGFLDAVGEAGKAFIEEDQALSQFDSVQRMQMSNLDSALGAVDSVPHGGSWPKAVKRVGGHDQYRFR